MALACFSCAVMKKVTAASDANAAFRVSSLQRPGCSCDTAPPRNPPVLGPPPCCLHTGPWLAPRPRCSRACWRSTIAPGRPSCAATHPPSSHNSSSSSSSSSSRRPAGGVRSCSQPPVTRRAAAPRLPPPPRRARRCLTQSFVRTGGWCGRAARRGAAAAAAAGLPAVRPVPTAFQSGVRWRRPAMQPSATSQWQVRACVQGKQQAYRVRGGGPRSSTAFWSSTPYTCIRYTLNALAPCSLP